MINYYNFSGVWEIRHLQTWKTFVWRSERTRSFLHNSLCRHLWKNWHENGHIWNPTTRGKNKFWWLRFWMLLVHFHNCTFFSSNKYNFYVKLNTVEKNSVLFFFSSTWVLVSSAQLLVSFICVGCLEQYIICMTVMVVTDKLLGYFFYSLLLILRRLRKGIATIDWFMLVNCKEIINPNSAGFLNVAWVRGGTMCRKSQFSIIWIRGQNCSFSSGCKG